tara:strand:- start:3549 stop:3941 length:393 start_codon:yes stop_codon:yes gene_type:complete
MVDPASISAADSLKNMLKDPLFYVIAIFVLAGTWLIKDAPELSTTWYVGLCMVIFGGILLVVQLISAITDNSFQRRYADLIRSQADLIDRQRETINSLSRTSIAAHDTMTKTSDEYEGYRKVRNSETSTE